MQTLREAISQYKAAGKAIGHFNFSDSNQLKAIAMAAKESGLPVIAGLSEGEREFFPLSHAKALVELYRADGIQIYLNADHTYSVEKVEAAIAAGCDSVIFDGAKLPFEENAKQAAACVALARASGRDVIIESELGYIGQSSKILTELPAGAALTPEMMTSVEDAKNFISQTGIDCFAPAVGNIHGMVGVAKDPALNAVRVKEISDAVGIPLVLHGASGNTEADIVACIKAGVAVVHINTELRVTYRDSLKNTLNSGDEVAPYKFLAPSVAAMQTFLVEKMRLFAGL
ncbi:MAG TPA: class II fructose-bisphosphate aldolase [Candidatus Paceibacterota bacterium]|nr:class II fructose-bisphosphate aldolase [Candidatus Paceibacterota bacterium]